MENKNVNKITYEEEKIQQLINLLNTVPISGFVQVKTMNNIFDILSNPLPDNQEVNNVQESKNSKATR